MDGINVRKGILFCLKSRYLHSDVVILPPYISLEAIVGEDYNIQIVKESEVEE